MVLFLLRVIFPAFQNLCQLFWILKLVVRSKNIFFIYFYLLQIFFLFLFLSQLFFFFSKGLASFFLFPAASPAHLGLFWPQPSTGPPAKRYGEEAWAVRSDRRVVGHRLSTVARSPPELPLTAGSGVDVDVASVAGEASPLLKLLPSVS